MAEPVRTPELVPTPIDLSDAPKPSFFRRKPANRESHVSVMPGAQQQFLLPRLISLCLLGLVLYGLFHAGRAGYYLATDAQIAPLLLSPDSDAVTSSRLSLMSLLGERDAVTARIEVTDNALHADREAQKRLHELRAKVTASGLAFSGEVSSANVSAAVQDRKHLAEQRGVLIQSIDTQRSYVEDLRRQLEAGVVRRADVAREENELRRLQLLELQNQRDALSTQTREQEVALTHDSLRKHGTKLLAPEVLRHQEQLLRIDLELINLEADERGKLAQLEAEKSQAARLDGLIAQIKSRPVYRAVEHEQQLAFVPYTQLSQVKAGASVYHCKVWSAFDCQAVGKVGEILAGEIATQDPWGSPARGQYAVLQLTDADAARSKILRVREPISQLELWPLSAITSAVR